MEWKKYRLGCLSHSIQTGPFGSQLHQSDYSEEGTPVIMPKDIVEGRVVEDNIARVSDIHIQRLKRHKVKCGDVVYSRRGDVGRCALVGEKEDGWLCGTGCLKVELNKEKVLPPFLFYILQRQDSVGWVESHAVGSTMPNLNTGILAKLPVFLPTLNLQHRIASILSTYDTLIENNTKRIHLLEKMAENLYKEWFVRLRFSGYEKAEIENGLPKGWKVESLGNLLDIRYGKDHKKLDDGDIPIYGSGGIMRYGDTALYEGCSVLIPRKGSLNNIIYVEGKFWTVDTMFYSVPKKNNICFYMYYVLSLVDMTTYNAGAALPSMTASILNRMKVVLPDRDVLMRFDGLMQANYKQKCNLQHQNSILVRQRDLLLPRLMSGKLEVKP